MHTSLQPTFDLVKRGHAPGMCQLGNPDLGSPAGSREASRGSTEQSTLDNQGGGSVTWVAPGRQGAYAHACRGAVPLCKQKRSSFKAGLKGRVVTFESREHAEQEGRVICPLCMQLPSKIQLSVTSCVIPVGSVKVTDSHVAFDGSCKLSSRDSSRLVVHWRYNSLHACCLLRIM